MSRTVCLNEVPQELWAAHQKALLIHATGIFFSRSGQQLKDVWPKVQRIYEKFGMPSEWQLSDQADVMGYRLPEHQLTPGSEFELQAPTPLFWHPGVAAAMPGDTVLVQNGGCEILTGSTAWPDLRVQVKGHDVTCPGLLLIHDAKVAAKSTDDQPVHSLFQVETGVQNGPTSGVRPALKMDPPRRTCEFAHNLSRFEVRDVDRGRVWSDPLRVSGRDEHSRNISGVWSFAQQGS